MDRILFAADVDDPVNRLPIYIFDTSFLPSTEQISYDEFIPALMGNLPSQPYVLIMFSCGLNKISWIWGIKFLKKFLADKNNLDNLWKIITVHDSWFIKGITQVLNNFNLTKKNIEKVNRLVDSFTTATLNELLTAHRKNTVIHCTTISELSSYVNITGLKISLNVYKHNCLLEEEVSLSMRTMPLVHQYAQIDPTSDPLLHHHFYQILQILDTFADKVELIFHKPGNKLNTDILFQCINRDQHIWINDWDIYCIAGVFKRFLTELPVTLIPIPVISLPVSDEIKYTKKVFADILQSHSNNNAQVLIQLCDLCYKIIANTSVTKHTSASLSKCLSHCISHELISSQNKDNILIINRFLKNVLDNWTRLRPSETEPIDHVVHGKENAENSFVDYELFEEKSPQTETNNNGASVLNVSNLPLNSPKTRAAQLSHKASVNSMFSDCSKHSASTIASTVSNQSTKKPEKPSIEKSHSRSHSLPQLKTSKKPVIRGRRVGELAKLYEERAQGIELLNSI